MRRRFTVAIALLVLVVAMGVVYILRTERYPSIPILSPRASSDTHGVEFLRAQKTAAYYREQIHRDPDDVDPYLLLAQLFLQEGRITGKNSEYIPKACLLLEQVEQRDPENVEAMITRAQIAATLHHFHDAAEMAERAIRANPSRAVAYGILCDALAELGRYEDAVAACDRMMSIRPDLRSYARAAHLRDLHGQTPGAIEAMTLAAESGVHGTESRAWVLCRLGMLYFNQGSLDTAEHVFRGTLDERPGYAHALSGLALVRSHQGKVNEAIALYRQAIDILEEPGFYEGMAELYEAMGLASEAKGVCDRAEELYLREKEGGEDNDMERARFLLLSDRRIDDGLRLAYGALERRPGIHAYEVLAMGLYKNGRLDEAAEAITIAMRLGTRDASMYYLAGLIAVDRGEMEYGCALLTMALSINPNFSLIGAADARRLLEEYGSRE